MDIIVAVIKEVSLVKVKSINVSAQVIGEVLKMAAQNAIPVDGKVIRVNYDHLMNNFQLVVESKEFDDVPEGSMIPQHEDPVVSKDVIDMLRGKRG